jgi:SMC interacting uncharacterized protein involved in chromosome segregation
LIKVSELANDLGVSRQTIYNHIDKLQPKIDNHIDKFKGAKVIDKQGVEMIQRSVKDKSNFDNDQNKVNSKGDEEKAKLYQRQIELLEKQIDQLEKQVEKKDQQIERLHVMLQQSQMNVESLTGEVEKTKEEGFIDKIKNLFK